MLRLIKSQAGNGVLMAVMGLAVAGGAYTLMQQNRNIQEVTREDIKRDEGQVIIEKLRAVGSYLVSNGLIVCKQGLFAFASSYKNTPNEKYYTNRCKWTGMQYENGEVKHISPERAGLSNFRYVGFSGQVVSWDDISNTEMNLAEKDRTDFGFLAVDVDTSRLGDLLQGGQEEGSEETFEILPLKGVLKFKLYNFAYKEDENGNPIGDPLELGETMGDYTLFNAIADADKAAVLIKAEAAYQKTFKQSNGGEPRVVEKKLDRYFAVRRPIALPQIKVDSGICAAGCNSASTLDDQVSECRGPQEGEGSMEVKGTIKNLGPGALYATKAEKVLVFDRSVAGMQGAPEDSKELMDLMPNRDYLLPNEEVEFGFNVQCPIMYPTTMTRTERVECDQVDADGDGTSDSDADGNVLCADPDGGPPLPMGSVISESEPQIEQHVTNIGNIELNIDVSGMAQASKVQLYAKRWLQIAGNEIPPMEDGTVIDQAYADRMEEMGRNDDENPQFIAYVKHLEKARVPLTMRNPAGMRDPQDPTKELDPMTILEPARQNEVVSQTAGLTSVQEVEVTTEVRLLPPH